LKESPAVSGSAEPAKTPPSKERLLALPAIVHPRPRGVRQAGPHYQALNLMAAETEDLAEL